jgi:SAM-dependent methyltransferase
VRLAVFDSPDGRAALSAADALADAEPLRAASALRRQGFAPDLAAAALTQAVLRRKAVGKFGPDAAALLFSRTGLEQSTRSVVAARRAARLAASGARSVADLGCGVGADTLAFARAGLRVQAVDASPEATFLTAYNASALGLTALVSVGTADATSVPLDDVDAVFCDPARRTATGRRVFDPTAYSPPWDFVTALPGRVPRTVLKLAPGIDHALLPPGAEAEWVSVDGDLVEAAVWCGPLADVPRRATLLRAGKVHELTGTGAIEAELGPVRDYLYDPDSAVIRAHLVSDLASTLDATLADPTIGYLYADTVVETPFARRYVVRDQLPVAQKKLRAALRARDIGTLTILKRGSALDIERLRHGLHLSGSQPATIALTRVAGAPAFLLLEQL